MNNKHTFEKKYTYIRKINKMTNVNKLEKQDPTQFVHVSGYEFIVFH